ncbi:MAG: S-adenosylmethionine:tRNA ribosyltransferase-isomerase, partial [Thermomicrobiaceae bacterium]|nr:S-adenosylmethionine:tRNA ribosyltransferase-isomerase [Thermomicrobiaceae bacterium]
MPERRVTDTPLLLSDYDYDLPAELIAQTPIEPRDASRLMVVHRSSGEIEHRRFYEIGEYLRPGDLLVINDTRVIPARLHGRRPTGGVAEILLVRRLEPGLWEALGRPMRRLRPGTAVDLVSPDGEPLGERVEVAGRREGGLLAVRLPA